MSDALTWADLFTNGSLIDLNVSMWDGLVKVHPEDMGVDRDAVKGAITFGHERLVPVMSLQAIRDAASKARGIIDSYSIPFKLVPGSRFLPRSTRADALEALNKAHTEFHKAVNDFMDKYEGYKIDHRPTLRYALVEASGDVATAEHALARITRLYPAEGELRQSFGLSWSTFSIAAPRDGGDGEEQGSAIAAEIGHMVDRVREQLTEKVTDILDLAARGGRITEKTYNSALRFCERVDTLNIFADDGLKAAVRAVRAAVSAAKSGEDPGAALTNGLGAVTTELQKSRDSAINSAAAMMAGQAERRFGL